MKKVVKKKKNNKFFKIVSIVLLILSIFSFSVLLYFDILPKTYLIMVGIISTIIILFTVHNLNNSTNIFIKGICLLLVLLFIFAELFLCIYAFGTIDFLNNIYDTGYRSEDYGLYVLSDDIKSIKDLNNKTIGYLKDDENIDKALNKLNNKIKYEKKDFDSITSGVNSLKKQDIDGLFLNEALMSVYLEEHEDILNKISSIELLFKNKSEFKAVNVAKKPFVVYISGIDTTGRVNKSARSDVNILAFVNPKTSKILLVNTPRDYYVELYSKKSNDKLTHAGIYGIEESAKTLGLLYDVDVNYYFRINFTSFIKIIDDLGGIVVDVDKPDFRYNENNFDCGIGYICEQNSKREWGDKTIYIKAGKGIKLNGEQALAYSRNRHQFADGDIARGKHQGQIIKAIIEKAISPSIITKYNNILKNLSKGVITNIDQNTITKLINFQLDNNVKWDIESISAKGENAYDECYSLGKYKAFVLKPNEESLQEIREKVQEIMN